MREEVDREIRHRLGDGVRWLEHSTGEPHYESSEHINEFVGRVPHTVGEFENTLADLGFQRVGRQSWRRFEEESDHQLHAFLYDGASMPVGDVNHTYIYAHWELQWEKHPWGNYRRHDYDPHIGVRKMKDFLEQAGVPFEPIKP